MWARSCAARSRKRWGRADPEALKRKKSRARSPAKVEVRQKSKPSRGNGRHGSAGRKKSGAALKSATGDIGCWAPICNAACLIKGLHKAHGSCHLTDKIEPAIELGG